MLLQRVTEAMSVPLERQSLVQHILIAAASIPTLHQSCQN